MRILLDECVPEQVRNAFTHDTVSTVKEVGWRGLKNGKLLEEVQVSMFLSSLIRIFGFNRIFVDSHSRSWNFGRIIVQL